MIQFQVCKSNARFADLTKEFSKEPVTVIYFLKYSDIAKRVNDSKLLANDVHVPRVHEKIFQ